MENQKQISNTPMILGIIGGILGLPTAICSGACAAIIDNAANNTVENAVSLFWIGLIGTLIGLVSSFLYKSNPKVWGAMMLLAGVLSAITLVSFNLLSAVIAILFLIGGLISISQKKSSPQIM